MYGENPLEKLVGHKVTGLFRNADKDRLRFVLESGDSVHCYTDGDCYSHSWIEHIEGVCNLIGATVRKIEDGAEVPSIETDGETIQFYNYRIVTERGFCNIEMRNSSNGYYGGSLDAADGTDDSAPIPIADDF